MTISIPSALDTVSTVLIASGFYEYAICNFGDSLLALDYPL